MDERSTVAAVIYRLAVRQPVATADRAILGSHGMIVMPWVCNVTGLKKPFPKKPTARSAPSTGLGASFAVATTADLAIPR